MILMNLSYCPFLFFTFFTIRPITMGENSLSVNFRKMFPARKSGRGGGDMMLRSCCTTDGNSSHHDVDLQTVKRLTRFKYPL